ncbi:hypothetical protein MAUB1S_00382 [Mycolicibacterium aubagnense]
MTSPASATPGISTHEVSCGLGPASDTSRLKVKPTTTANGAMATANMVNWYDINCRIGPHEIALEVGDGARHRDRET